MPSACYAAVEIGGSKLQMAVGDPAGGLRRRVRLEVDRALGAEGIRAQIQAHLTALCREARPAGIGVGFGGPIEWRSGRICCSHHIEGWSDFLLGPWLHSLTGLPVSADNDANVAALGEARSGAGRGHSTVFYVTLGSGVGGGLVAGGAIFHGAAPGEAEIGHVRLDRDSATVESRCAGWAVDRQIRAWIERHPGGTLAQLAGASPGGEARHLRAALDLGDEAARRLLLETAEDLAFGLSHVTHLMHPEIVVIGGGLSLVGEPLRQAVAEALPQFVMEAFRPGPQIALASLGEDAVPMGAIHLAHDAAPA
jgi:glucokinase